MATETAIEPDQEKLEQFVERALGDFSATLTTLLCALGDRLGLFRTLATKGPATPAELGERAGVSERYAAEWSRGLAAAGYLAHDGVERFTGTWFENLLLGEWLPARPHLERRLERGCSVADVGCGAGRALIELAQAYPRSRFVGFDNFEGQIARARHSAEREGIADRVTFELLYVTEGFPGDTTW